MDKVMISPTPEPAPRKNERQEYEAPAVVYEAPLEVRAGTPPSGIPNPLDLTGSSEG
jgi:hypothetical protein